MGFENQSVQEVIEYFERNSAGELFRILDTLPEDADHINMDRKTVTLYRGDTRDNLDGIRDESGDLRRDYPIYFTESKEAAVEEYAPEKLDDSEPYLVEIEAPFDSFVYLNHKQSKQVEINPERLDLKPEKMYFMQPFKGNAEFASVRVPDEWIKSIEEL